MERDFQDFNAQDVNSMSSLRPPWKLSWHVLVAEAKARRKEQKLSQRHLAALADVSAPTVSRFELGKQDIQLSSVLKILSVLGIVSKA